MNYTKSKDTITASMMCATGHSAGGITDTCQGDSGGGSCGLFTGCCVKLRVFGEDLVKITKFEVKVKRYIHTSLRSLFG